MRSSRVPEKLEHLIKILEGGGKETKKEQPEAKRKTRKLGHGWDIENRGSSQFFQMLLK